MFPAVAAFGGGLAVKERLERITLPRIQRADESGPTFKLSVRLLAASINGFESRSIAERQQPYVEVGLGEAKKASEYGDFVGSSSSGKIAELQDCPWRFSDTLTFTARLQDVVGRGLRFRLAFRRDYVLGPLVFELQPAEVGEGSIDLKNVLSKCVLEKRPWGDGDCIWTTPLIPLPMRHVKNGISGAATAIGEAVAYVATIFSVDDNPELILNAASARTLPLGRPLSESFHAGLEMVTTPVVQPIVDMAGAIHKTLEPVNGEDAARRAGRRADVTPLSQIALESPELDPNGWQCRFGPNGQVYWHHAALGKAPWEAETPRQPVSAGTTLAATAAPGSASPAAVPRAQGKPSVSPGAHLISASFSAFSGGSGPGVTSETLQL